MKIGPWTLNLRRPRPRTEPVVIRVHPDGHLTKASLADIQTARVGSDVFTTNDWAPTVYGEQMAKSSLVYRAVTARSHAVRSAPIKVMRRLADGSSEPVDVTHPVQELFSRVNPWWTSADLLAATETYLSLWGKAFWFIDREGPEITLWPLRPDRTTVIPGKPIEGEPFDAVNYIRGYMYEPTTGTGASSKVALLPDEVVWFRYFNPLDEYAGLSPVAPTRLTQDMIHNAVRFNADFFKNGAMPQDLIFMAEGPLDDDAVKEFYDRLEQRQKGAGNQHKPMIWDMSKGAGPKTLGLSQRDMEFMGTLEYGLQDAARVWGVPPPLLMSEKQTTYNNVREARILFYVETISEEWDFLEMEINELMMPLLTNETDLFVQFDRSRIRPLQEAMAEQQKRDLEEVEKGTLTVNEFRMRYGREPVAWGDVWWAPSTVMPVSSEEAPVLSEPGTLAQPALRDTRAVFTDEDVLVHLKAFEERLTATESRVADFQKRLFRRQEVAALRELRKMGDRAILNAVFKQGGEPIFNPAEWSSAYQTEGARLLTQILVLAGQTQAEQFGLGPFDAGDIGIQEWTQDRAAFWGTRVDAETASLLVEEIEAGILNEESIRQLEARVRKVFGPIADFRAERIARTEAISATNQGHLTLYNQSPVVEKKQWLTSIDGRERDAHRQAHRQIVDKNAPFLVGGESLPAPGVGGSAGNVINCLLPDTRVTGSALLAASRLAYEGPVIELLTEFGDILTVTPNHPILTDKGFVPAQKLRPGDNLIGGTFEEGMPPIDEYMANMPPKVEDIYGAFNIITFPRSRAPAIVFDFHGDARHMNGDIEIIPFARQLQSAVRASGLQPPAKYGFSSTDVVQSPFLGFGPLDKLIKTTVPPAHSTVSGGAKAATLIGAGAGHTGIHGGTPAPWRDAVFNQPTSQEGPGNAPLVGEGLLRFPGQITLKKLVEIHHREFSGHVYDLQSHYGLYNANGIFCHNCRCTMKPILVDTSKRALTNGHTNGLQAAIEDTTRIIDGMDGKTRMVPYMPTDAARLSSKTVDVQNDDEGNPVHFEEHYRYDS